MWRLARYTPIIRLWKVAVYLSIADFAPLALAFWKISWEIISFSGETTKHPYVPELFSWPAQEVPGGTEACLRRALLPIFECIFLDRSLTQRQQPLCRWDKKNLPEKASPWPGKTSLCVHVGLKELLWYCL